MLAGGLDAALALPDVAPFVMPPRGSSQHVDLFTGTLLHGSSRMGAIMVNADGLPGTTSAFWVSESDVVKRHLSLSDQPVCYFESYTHPADYAAASSAETVDGVPRTVYHYTQLVDPSHAFDLAREGLTAS